MDRNTLITQLAVAVAVTGSYELLGFELTVVFALAVLIMAAAEIAKQTQDDGPLTADDLE